MSDQKVKQSKTVRRAPAVKNGNHTVKKRRTVVDQASIAKEKTEAELPIPEFFDQEEELYDWAEGSILTMLASEEAWARNWDTPEEDEAWADL